MAGEILLTVRRQFGRTALPALWTPLPRTMSDKSNQASSANRISAAAATDARLRVTAGRSVREVKRVGNGVAG